MSALTQMIKQAAANLAGQTEKVGFIPTPGGQIPPPAGGMPGDPMAGGMPPGDPMAGGMPPGDPMAGGMPPMDPGMMDPSMMAPPGGPMDPGMMDPSMMPPEEPEQPPVEPANDGSHDYDGDGRPDVMVPLGPITDFATRLIEATKGRRTADAQPPKEEQPEMSMPGGPAAHIGGAPAGDPGMLMPKLGQLGRQIADHKAGR